MRGISRRYPRDEVLTSFFFVLFCWQDPVPLARPWLAEQMARTTLQFNHLADWPGEVPRAQDSFQST
jgi:hypothetical protein